jgi:hypothetical protein
MPRWARSSIRALPEAAQAVLLPDLDAVIERWHPRCLGVTARLHFANPTYGV